MAAKFITTMDNPYNYFTQFDQWYEYDTTHGYDVIGCPYNTLNYVARIACTDPDMSDHDYEEAVNAAIDEIFRMNITGNYRIVYEDESGAA